MRLESIVIYPGSDPVTVVNQAGRQTISIRAALAFDQFAEVLSKRTTAEVRVEDTPELPPPADGVIFICRQDVVDRSLARQADRTRELASHTVLVDVVRGYELEMAERLGLAAAIGGDHYSHWQGGHNIRRPAELTGLKSVGRALGATWRTAPAWEGPNYALLRHPQFRELPTFLAAYLDAYVLLL
jgi:hypothetical protein